jgi:hypothetical protein
MNRPPNIVLQARSLIVIILWSVAVAVLVLWLTGCTTMPPKTVSVAWINECSGGYRSRDVVFVDTAMPLYECVQHARAEDKVMFLAFALAGMPPAACAIQYSDGRAEVYIPLSAPASYAWAAAALRSPEDAITWEIDNVMQKGHPWWLPWMKLCDG